MLPCALYMHSHINCLGTFLSPTKLIIKNNYSASWTKNSSDSLIFRLMPSCVSVPLDHNKCDATCQTLDSFHYSAFFHKSTFN